MMTYSARIESKSQRGTMTSFIPPNTESRSGPMASASSNWLVQISFILRPRMARFAYSNGSS